MLREAGDGGGGEEEGEESAILSSVADSRAVDEQGNSENGSREFSLKLTHPYDLENEKINDQLVPMIERSLTEFVVCLK